MIDFRLYRVAWLPALAAFVTMMFSLEGVPDPFEPAAAPADFDARRAEANLRGLLAAGDEREPGGAGDAAAADLVAARFREIEAGSSSVQPFEADVDGSPAELLNLILTLPGDSEQVVLVVAARDSASGTGAASSAAATATLMELAEVLGATDHERTFVLVSTDGGTVGAIGIREFLEAFPERELLDAAVVISQPASAAPRPPHVLRHSTDDASTSIGLVETAAAAVSDQAGRRDEDRDLVSGLARLAMPVAVGEQGVLIAEGVDAVAISSAGERPLPVSEDTFSDVDAEVLGQFASATLATLLALDQSLVALEHGPSSYVGLGGSLVPGWAVSLLALALILPAGVAAFDGIARSARRRAGTVRALAWAFALGLPLLGALVLLYLLSLAGIVADPPYPFDPVRFDAGAGELVLVVVLGGFATSAFFVTGLARLPRRARREALVPALGTAAVAGALASWLLNPYLALLFVPAAHAWLLAGLPTRFARGAVLAAAVASLVPALVAMRSVLQAVGAGAWDVVLMIADGHIATPTLIALCPLLGAAAGLLVLAWRPGAAPGEPIGGRPQPHGVLAGSIPAAAPMDPPAPGADAGTEGDSLPGR